MISTRHKQDLMHLIHGPAGQLELQVSAPIGSIRKAWAIICHPHPLHGGTMQNKVVTTLAKTFQHLGLSTVRFNFRGVGNSEGKFDQGYGELDDLLKVIEWVLSERPDHEIWLAGFSFGAYVVAKAGTQIPVGQIVLVAPPVTHFHMEALATFLSPWILVQGDLDEVVPADAVYAWAEQRAPKPTLIRFPQATHFFHGQLLELRRKLEEALQN
jgi:uncharacterized protein